jgi:outer membrane protein insertion porin family
VGVGYPLSKDWRVSATYGIKDVQINIERKIEQRFPDSVGLDSNLAFSIARDTLNTREVFQPSSGSLNSLTATVASKGLGSQLSYVLLNYSGKKYLQIFEDDAFLLGGSVLSFGLRADYLRGIEGRSTPFNERFVPGGIYSIRGHLFRSLSGFDFTTYAMNGTRRDDTEFGLTRTEKIRLGGNKQVILNIEYLFDIFKEARIKGVLFFDVGNSFPEQDWKLWNTRESAGFGFRWFSPLGPLRFEWGIPLDKKPDEDSILFDFSIGAPF